MTAHALTAHLCRLAAHLTVHDLPAPITARINPSSAAGEQPAIEVQLWAATTADIAAVLACWADALIDPVCTAQITAGYRGTPTVHIHVVGWIAGAVADVVAVDELHGRFADVGVGHTVSVPLETLRSWASAALTLADSEDTFAVAVPVAEPVPTSKAVA